MTFGYSNIKENGSRLLEPDLKSRLLSLTYARILSTFFWSSSSNVCNKTFSNGSTEQGKVSESVYLFYVVFSVTPKDQISIICISVNLFEGLWRSDPNVWVSVFFPTRLLRFFILNRSLVVLCHGSIDGHGKYHSYSVILMISSSLQEFIRSKKVDDEL